MPRGVGADNTQVTRAERHRWVGEYAPARDRESEDDEGQSQWLTHG